MIMEAHPTASFVYNEIYDQTNTSKSLLRALRASPESGVLWLNGDVVFDHKVLERVADRIAADKSFVCVNTSATADEEVKKLQKATSLKLSSTNAIKADIQIALEELARLRTGMPKETVGSSFDIRNRLIPDLQKDPEKFLAELPADMKRNIELRTNSKIFESLLLAGDQVDKASTQLTAAQAEYATLLEKYNAALGNVVANNAVLGFDEQLRTTTNSFWNLNLALEDLKDYILTLPGTNRFALDAAIPTLPSQPKADGGFMQHGSDTIPALLSPGEFVMNAKSSRRFYSQLQAMNSYSRFADGGPVTIDKSGRITIGFISLKLL
jgi:hypothetical protein